MKSHIKRSFGAVAVIISLFLIPMAIAAPVYAWFSLQNRLAAYAPVSSPEALYIGAGHTELENDRFEDIRYMYFNGMDVNSEDQYIDRVFCVYGKCVSGYRLQLAYTTNNQFTYELYRASESEVESEHSVGYTTHDVEETYYYTIVGDPLAGNYLNKTVSNGKTLASDEFHEDSYESYSRSNVNDYAEPIYWQTTAVERGNTRGNFVNYYILRVRTDAKSVNDRETDIVCIAAKSFSLSQLF